MKLPQLQTETISLFLLDGLANAIDFLFHFWMGRVLIPSDFAVLQTLNSIALVYVTASGVFQPVVGRFVAEARGKGHNESIPAIFQSFLRAAIWLGLALSILIFLFSRFIAELFNLPVWTIQLSAALIFFSTLRPIAAGVLQGQERFIEFGFARLALSVGRIVIVFFLLQAGLGLTGAVIALPFGWLLSVLCAFLFLGNSFWKKETFSTSYPKNVTLSGSEGSLPRKCETLRSQQPLPQRDMVFEMSSSKNLLNEGWRLSIFALVAYFAYMSLTSLDLVWVNRHLSGDSAGAYASLVLMRRIVALLPAVAVTVMFPRIARLLAEGQPTHRLLIQTAVIILAASGALTILYFLFAEPLITIIFGNAYQPASSLLGWMGLAMIGVSLSSIWLNYYLAEKPRNFVILLIAAVALEWFLLNVLPISLDNAVIAFGATGWALALSGLVMYLFKSELSLRGAAEQRRGSLK